MNYNSILKYFINKPLHMKLVFVVMFILYGIIISAISYKLSNHYQIKKTQEKLVNSHKQSFTMRTSVLKDKMTNFVSEINILRESTSLKSYIEKNKKESIKDLFSLVINSTPDISQLRYINEFGDEKLRFDRTMLGASGFYVEKEKLQNKASRYYFKEIKKLKEKDIWYSKLDLNIEHGKIQKPIVPTLRVGTPVYIKGEFKGIIIMNIFFKDIINEFISSPFFYITIFDKDGNFIHHKHPDEKGIIVDYSWSKYLGKSFNLDIHKKVVQKSIENKDMRNYYFKETITDIIPNQDKLSVFFEPKLLKIKELEQDDSNYIITVTFIVLLISIPLSFLISTIPNILNTEIFETKKSLEEQLNIVNEYVFLSITDVNGIVLDVSDAYTELTGYKKEELLGKKHNLLRHPSTSNAVYENLWNTILDKKVWTGELKNIKKDGSEFDAKILIKANCNEYGEIKTFSAYVQDITYQKKIEKMSITDELTSLYNRREFNRVFKRFVSHSKRYNNNFSMIILDIDFFKQYNDTYGHHEGDIVLKEVSKRIEDLTKRSSDISFRLGGEEFGVIFTSSNEENALKFANKLVQGIENLKIEHKTSKVSEYITISVGTYFSNDISLLSENEIYKLCDEALYKAKQNGRNQAVLA